MAAFIPPTLSDLQALSTEYGLGCTNDDLKVYQEVLTGTVESYKRVLELPEPSLLAKYPRKEGYRPSAQENECNQWYWKCSIKGAPCGALHGRKIAMKDTVYVAGVPLMNGSKTLEGFVPDQDATIVIRTLDAGGEIIGKTTCEDLCLSGASYNTTYGPVRNPWNKDHSAGGSSSGSGVVVALGEADMAIGGDQGGSIRIPSSACGIVGLKPTFGLVPYTGVIPIDTTLDHVGPMARTVKDCALFLKVLAGFDDNRDPRQPSCGYDTCPEMKSKSEKSLSELRIGILKEGFEGDCTPTVQKVVRNAIDTLKKSGRFAAVEEVSIPMHADGHHIWCVVGIQGGTNQLVGGAGYGTGLSGHLNYKLAEKLRQGLKTKANTLSHTCKMLTLCGGFINEHHGQSIYARAQTLALELRRQYDAALQKYDVLVMPTLPQVPTKLPTKDSTLLENIGNSLNMIQNTCPFNMTHHPALTLNAGFCPDTGLPIGLQIVGKNWDDFLVLRVAEMAEELLQPMQTRKL